MGMFDTILFFGKHADRLVCAAGHKPTNWQTKDIDEGMGTYVCIDGILYQRQHTGDWQPRRPDSDGPWRFVTEAQLTPTSITETCFVYTSCAACDPVCFEQPGEWAYERVGEAFPWVEYQVEFINGVLTGINPVRVESRDDVRRKYPQALPDDDRIARRHLERRKKERA